MNKRGKKRKGNGRHFETYVDPLNKIIEQKDAEMKQFDDKTAPTPKKVNNTKKTGNIPPRK